MIKTTIKAKATLKITNADTQMFQDVLNAGSSISQASTFSIEQGLREMSIENLQLFQAKLKEKAGKTTNKVKMHSVINYLTIFVNLTTLQGKLATTMDAFKTLVTADLEETWTTSEGEIEFERFKETVSNVIAVKQNQLKSDMQE